MGCIQTGRRTIISVNPILGQLNKQENLTTMQSPTANKKRSTLKEITKLAFNSKNIKIKSCISLANSKPEDDYRIINKLGKGSFGSVYKVEHKITKEIRAMKIIKRNILSNNEKKEKENKIEDKKTENKSIVDKNIKKEKKEKNRVRSLIRTYFPERDCFVMVRPVEEEKNLQKLQHLPDEQLRVEFLEQAKNFRNKVFKKIKPKAFHGQLITGSMLLELVQSILDSINGGGIPVIENSWKYVMKNECVKNGS